MVFVFSLILLLLPVGVAGIHMLRDQVLLQRSQQYLAETLTAAQLGLIAESLADGQPVLDRVQAENIVKLSFQKNLPAILTGKLTLFRVSTGWHQIPYDPLHWMGIEQPTRLPVVTIEAILTDDRGQKIPLHESIELLLD